MVNWDQSYLNGLVADWANAHAQRLDIIAQEYIDRDFSTSLSPATPDSMTASIIAPEPSLVREYGTASIEPDPWGITALMEASR